jgi:type IV secretory pathway TrbF-like protein
VATALPEPYARPRDFLARMAGLGRPVLWSLAATSLVSTVAAVAAGGWAWHEARTSADRARVFVAQIDSAGAVVGCFEVAAEWQPEGGQYLDFAQRWIRNLRSHPTDIETLKVQRRDVIWSTDARVYGPLQDEMKREDELYRQTALDVSRLAANMVDQQSSRAVVLVRWTEQARGAAPPTSWSATLTVVHVPPRVVTDYERNPLGLFVTNYQITQTQDQK